MSLLTLDDGVTKVATGISLYDGVHGKDTAWSAGGNLKAAGEVIIGDFRFDTESMLEIFDITVVNNGRYEIEAGGTGARTIADANGDNIDLLSKEIFYYQAGRGYMLKQSIITGNAGVAGVVREWGLMNGDRDNGTFLRLSGTVLSWVILRDGVETVINASAWDIPQTHDGNGHLFYIQFLWLGVADLYLYRDEVLVHTHSFLGTSTEFSLGTPDLKLYYCLDNVSSGASQYLKFGCASIVSEGGVNATRLNQSPRPNDLAILNKSAIVGESEEGHYHNAGVNEDKELTTYNKQNLIQHKEQMMQLQGVIQEVRELKNLIAAIFDEEPRKNL